jgi:hypothetical protein
MGGIDHWSTGSFTKYEPSTASQLALGYELAREYDRVTRNLLNISGHNVAEDDSLDSRSAT